MPPSMYRQDSRQGPAAGSTGSSLDLWIAPSQKEVVLQKTPTAFLYRHMWGFSDAHVPSTPCRSSVQTVPLVFLEIDLCPVPDALASLCPEHVSRSP